MLEAVLFIREGRAMQADQSRLNNRRRSWWGLPISAALLATGAALPNEPAVSLQPLQLADIDINIPVIVVPRGRTQIEREVTVRFIASGDDWATIYLDGNFLFRAANTRRTYSVTLDPGAYYLEITGVTRFDSWGAGYLDVGRDDANIVVVRYGQDTGIQVAGNDQLWFPE